VKREMNDAADAEAICEADMRLVPIESADTQGATMDFRIHELQIRQRTRAINALCGHLSEFGYIVQQGPSHAVPVWWLLCASGAG
jgi:transposase